jgi:hypothetical protein
MKSLPGLLMIFGMLFAVIGAFLYSAVLGLLALAAACVYTARKLAQ